MRIEALLLAVDRPISENRLAEVLGLIVAPSAQLRAALSEAAESIPEVANTTNPRDGTKSPANAARHSSVQEVRDAIDRLNASYASQGRAFRIESVAGGRQIMTLPTFAPLLEKLRGAREQQKFSQASLETLAIVAYRQPILRSDIESIRGVACGEVLRSLMDRRLVRITGRAEEVGRPMLYGTTQEFLRTFGIAGVNDLPQNRELKPA
ncbi:MAG: SMC-Scp complex subunit ScpB [Planctomycetota bacterium]|nr:SMC-Scp complex subunit ScpB [Planctomycetota bacterium]